ncbi:MAG: ATP-dependent zinc metalloprotease FtsH [Patescibacteria group bacterium]|nr:ATP-dependent zinc metalloprotease FtsH [Patescibacteria group bacterium]
MNKLIKNLVFIFLIFLTISGVFALFSSAQEAKTEISFNQLAKDIQEEKIKEIIIFSNNDIVALYQNDEKAFSRKESELALSESLMNFYGVEQKQFEKVKISFEEKKEFSGLISLLFIFLIPVLFLGLFFFMIFRQAKGGSMQAFSFGKVKARLFGAEGADKEKIGFKDVAGLKEPKEELKEIVDFLKNPKKYLKIGAKIPRGVLLMGPPGTGKTLLARAVAFEAKVPFLSISGSEFIEMFVGVGSSRVRDLFATAKKKQPSIIFIDELDAIGRARGTGTGGGHDEREQTLNQILVEMDGFERDATTLVFAATNRPDVLDPALLRPGRFDRRIMLDLPDINDREEILKIHCQGKPLAQNIDLREVAERTPGFSGADLANIINEAALLTARKDRHQVRQQEILESIEKVLLGPERKSYILSKKEKEITAYHEAGHALVATLISEAEPVRKISIIARGRAAGYVLKMPSEEKKMKTKTEILAEMAVLLGGYCAEKLKFKEIATGASNDLERTSILARKLVKEYGMSALGPVSWTEKQDLMFLGQRVSDKKNYSEKIASEIDKEIEKFVKQAEAKAEKILKQNKKTLEKIAETLVIKETIERAEFEKIIKTAQIKKLK